MDPFFAVKKLASVTPDVILLDMEMPRLDGLSFLKAVMRQHPMPVVVFSSLTPKSSSLALQALEAGAVEVVSKPLKAAASSSVEGSLEDLRHALIAASQARIRALPGKKFPYPEKAKSKTLSAKPFTTTDKVVAIGASTGGTEAIMKILLQLPITCPGMIIVQHMPEVFTKKFAERLNGVCAIEVEEAKEGDRVLAGRALIAPGNHHMELRRSGAQYYVHLHQAPPQNRHRPSVDVLFSSVAKHAGANATGILLTGMGSDGASGLGEIKASGGKTIAQDEASAVVFGMPKAAIEAGHAQEVLSLEQIAKRLANQMQLK